MAGCSRDRVCECITNRSVLGLPLGEIGRVAIETVGDTPLHAQLFEGAFLDFHELGFDLDLANIVIAIQNIADAFDVSSRLRDDHRRSIIGQI